MLERTEVPITKGKQYRQCQWLRRPNGSIIKIQKHSIHLSAALNSLSTNSNAMRKHTNGGRVVRWLKIDQRFRVCVYVCAL